MSFLIGIAAGLFGGLVGLGGGIVMIPLMVGLLKVNQHKAHGTSLFALVFTALSGTIAYALKGSVDALAALLLMIGAVCTVSAGARYAHSLPEWKLKRAFGTFLILVSVFMLFKPYLPHISGPLAFWPMVVTLLLTGVFSGFIAGMMGVGGGVLMVPAMVLLAGFSQYTAHGTSLLAMIVVGSVGACTHWRLGNVRRDLLPGLIAGILIGAYLGGNLAHTFPEGWLRAVFALVLIWSGVRYLRAKMSLSISDSVLKM